MAGHVRDDGRRAGRIRQFACTDEDVVGPGYAEPGGERGGGEDSGPQEDAEIHGAEGPPHLRTEEVVILVGLMTILADVVLRRPRYAFFIVNAVLWFSMIGIMTTLWCMGKLIESAIIGG